MGVLLSFMFLVNVLGAIFLLPALAAWFNLARPLVKVKTRPAQATAGHYPLKPSVAAKDSSNR